MERTEPFVYISLREILFIHRLIASHIKQVAPAADDPIHKVLESLKAYESPTANLDMFVTLRLVNWMSGPHRCASLRPPAPTKSRSRAGAHHVRSLPGFLTWFTIAVLARND